MRIGLFFGSFNPVHTGHMIIAQHIAEFSELNQVWLVVSPHNPLKKENSLARDYDRLHLVNLAIGDHPHLRSSDVEFNLPKPSYTIDTLIYLKEKYPTHQFELILGGDNLKSLHKWKNYEILLRDYPVHLYHRADSDHNPYEDSGKFYYYDAPLLDISATWIRKLVKDGKSIRYYVPDSVFEYLSHTNIYR
ncbi:MAG: nicotinate-nucleotide adenylyltransferase [Saprospiraceae bacterium]|jgi:nicotinate-nucleotide adenylyltransferase|nr:nicotinate-nucleotide adenylyltransferase [Saprospiraceae bacterium]